MKTSWQKLLHQSVSLNDMLASESFDTRSFSQWIADELAARGIKKSAVVRRSRLNQTFAYQIMAGMRRPSRDKLVLLCFGMSVDADGACELLERGGVSPLRPDSRRDVIIAFCLDRGMGVSACDDLLWSLGETTLLDERDRT